MPMRVSSCAAINSKLEYATRYARMRARRCSRMAMCATLILLGPTQNSRDRQTCTSATVRQQIATRNAFNHLGPTEN